jgi:hypothetical protein
MEHMQDKAFDQFFKDQFEGAEMLPPPAVWNGIHKELKPARNRRPIFYWMAAASMVVALGVGLLFTRTEHLKMQGNAELVQETHREAGSNSIRTMDGSASSPVPEPDALRKGVKAPSKVFKAQSFAQADPGAGKRAHLAASETKLQAIQTNNKQQLLTAGKASLQKTETGLLSENELVEVELPLLVLTSRPGTVDEEAAMVRQSGDNTMEDARQTVNNERVRIRNAGDLVNFVVDKIDRREQKIVAFNTDDDDNSSLVALNIGPFRFNSKKHK